VIDPVLRASLAGAGSAASAAGRHWRLPVCYGGEFGPDLDGMAASVGLPAEEIVRRHASTTYRVYMLGFLPGFPFMGDLPEALALPRRQEPRVRVPAGSVATAGRLTAIYPWESPGGWHLLGRCPVPLFSPHWSGAALFLPGDAVSFDVVDAAEFARIEQRWQGSTKLPVEYLAVAEAA
jgi:KipI family sensor histidine kinase inhibitor